MVKMGDVWDRTSEVLGGRGGMLAGIAILTVFVPGVINAAYTSYAPAGALRSAIVVLLLIAVTIASIWGQLAIIAAATDPATTRPAAQRQATERLLPALGVMLVLGIVATIAFLPAIVLLVMSHLDFAAMANGTPPASPEASGPLLLAGLYMLVAFVVLLFVGARLLPLYAVVLRERLGLGAIGRAWRLTRRHTWRLVGAVLLFMIVVMIASWAAQAVAGLVTALVLGGDAVATVRFVGTVAAQAASTALTLVAIVFSAQAYVAFVARDAMLRARAAA
ncbi:hypothetical protein [Sphingomonas aquatilis]|uniref:MFS family permease n=1 Tax=Sphingomonas aquatilis TaxID=93063 RepID=A0AAW3TP55_9SPHN|nr:hypothetical protein [Sphingomonas aquatilis]MBB3875443.1 MFS family permease [Sphingomonas aquatilis]MCI4654833.1 hypothetical protein [Sphingomonas aquatilis]GEM73172.1 hypothetical protein SAQ01S_29380 [Sphingomonas aquatilis NBRC 16722]GKS02756.1 hypothetical protein Aug2020_04860 [Sphingomonas aquatilis]